ncbi:thiol:disulfide interchange protein DsbA/DsbL [Shewanella loihica]|uniref:Thiol:disulfide interchange protein n=1 Tax=Shewanella loihica (strain ATCC BAA-1088 / PV-4) TaxID=323850 RepID=A3Q9I9_SHELP|nr:MULTISPECIES: thiol:disulfide interchange protein DsbA/DsbL [Shewanella]ABO22137.1 DSBA oxidoreductase [Shewanella loihica PV-4]MCG9748124.1 thiol:disulfide interchange protein DsbA/DsbL [Shewanella sp. Isolate8]MCL2911681.1 thiol:disulfide interchange protein DsbA/DsbL [Shewanella aquimarina]QYJ82705.1 thiol:disulfide interchange protein DsbA/DsbL [Shewanella aegiceratis]QYJ90283.1 thiol:disulfide interchange protein DsbA/DsbL [Shewanella halotolerans]
MKKALLVALALLVAPMAALAADYKEGVHYTVINDGPATAKPEIAEFFSFYCPHCYNFAKTQVPKIKANLPEGVVFKQNHVEFIGREMGPEMSRAFAVANQLKVEDKMEHALFAAIHDKKQRFVSRDDIRQLFIANGVDGKDFDAAANSFMVSAQMAQMKRATENAKLSGVPALVVNGKYRVETGAIKSYDELLQIAYYLTSLK